MNTLTVVFYSFAFLSLLFAAMAVLSSEPKKMLFNLIGFFLTIAVLFLPLKAELLALAIILFFMGILITYFLVILKDKSKQTPAVSDGEGNSGLLKILVSGWILGLLVGVVLMSSEMVTSKPGEKSFEFSTSKLVIEMLDQHLLLFELFGLLVFIVVIGIYFFSKPLLEDAK